MALNIELALFLAWKKQHCDIFEVFRFSDHYNVDSGGTSIKNKDRINRRLFYLIFSQMMSLTTFASRGLKTGIWQVWSYLAAWSCSLLATAGLRVLTHSKAHTLTHMRRARRTIVLRERSLSAPHSSSSCLRAQTRSGTLLCVRARHSGRGTPHSGRRLESLPRAEWRRAESTKVSTRELAGGAVRRF